MLGFSFGASDASVDSYYSELDKDELLSAYEGSNDKRSPLRKRFTNVKEDGGILI